MGAFITLTNARLGKDPETRNSNNTNVTRFSVAVNRRFAKDKTDWFNVVCFGKLSDTASQYLHKGSKVNIIGRPQPDSYTNKDGQRVNTFDVIADEIEFAESKKEAESHAQANNSGSVDNDSDNGFVNVPEELDSELPFN